MQSLEMDVLRELSEDELEYIKSRLKEKLPYAIKDLYYICSGQKMKTESGNHCKLSDKVLPKFYTFRGGLKENCTIFGITGKENHTVWYFTFEESLNEIRKCLEKTKLIKWKSKCLFVTLQAEQIQPVFDYTTRNGIEITENEENSYYYLPIENALNFEIEIPDEVYLVQLEESDASNCNGLWKYSNENSELWIKSLILVHGGLGLRDKKNNSYELLSFAIINDHLAIGVLVTIEKAQRRGYGEIIVKSLARKLAERGLIPHVYINKQNEKGFKLFHKLGFRKIGDSNWITI